MPMDLWRRGRVTVHVLHGEAYHQVEVSQVLPGIDLEEPAAHLDRPTDSQAILACDVDFTHPADAQ